MRAARPGRVARLVPAVVDRLERAVERAVTTWIAASHLTESIAYQPGTITRTGPPCSTGIGRPFISYASSVLGCRALARAAATARRRALPGGSRAAVGAAQHDLDRVAVKRPRDRALPRAGRPSKPPGDRADAPGQATSGRAVLGAAVSRALEHDRQRTSLGGAKRGCSDHHRLGYSAADGDRPPRVIHVRGGEMVAAEVSRPSLA